MAAKIDRKRCLFQKHIICQSASQFAVLLTAVQKKLQVAAHASRFTKNIPARSQWLLSKVNSARRAAILWVFVFHFHSPLRQLIFVNHSLINRWIIFNGNCGPLGLMNRARKLMAINQSLSIAKVERSRRSQSYGCTEPKALNSGRLITKQNEKISRLFWVLLGSVLYFLIPKQQKQTHLLLLLTRFGSTWIS